MATLDFTKLHGTANDFVYVDARRGLPADAATLAPRLCDRHRGIGADGLILLLSSEAADCRMRILNSDGSTAEMCGNGIRGFAKFVLDRGLVRSNPLRVDTDAGVKTLRAELADGRVRRVAVDMGTPEWSGRKIPVDADSEGQIVGTVVDIRLHSKLVAVCAMSETSRAVRAVIRISNLEPENLTFRESNNVEIAEVMDGVCEMFSKRGVRGIHMIYKIVVVIHLSNVRVEPERAGLFHARPEHSRRVRAPSAPHEKRLVEKALAGMVLDVKARVEKAKTGVVIKIASVLIQVTAHISVTKPGFYG